MKPAIEIENLSKKFRIQSGRESYLSLRDSVQNLFRKNSKEDFYALKDVSFQVQQGESLGIIGKNGAGKSTLLKIISKITPPTSGSITYRGRVASLLEVGTGFHSELTGRENVFMNGSILGMKRSEIKKNFDAIVDFAGVEKFIDTPLKHYSSGMQLRLAFAVAAFLENEILIIDEVLAVGDADFQKKCLSRMDEVSKGGRTLLFVSHNLSAVTHLCKNGILLSNGKLEMTGDIQSIISRYISKDIGEFKPILHLQDHKRERGLQQIRFSSIEFNSTVYYPDSAFEVKLNVEINEKEFVPKGLNFGVYIISQMEERIYHISNMFIGKENLAYHAGESYIFKLPALRLKPGLYRIWLWMQAGGLEQDVILNNIEFEVQPGNVYQYANSDAISGAVQPDFLFNVLT